MWQRNADIDPAPLSPAGGDDGGDDGGGDDGGDGDGGPDGIALCYQWNGDAN